MGTRSLENLRGLIDEIDAQLVALLSERAVLALEIGKLKKATAKQAYDPSRERTVLESVNQLNTGPLPKGALEDIFATIMTACRELQIRSSDDIRR